MSDDADFAALRDYAKQVGPARAGHENLPPGHPPLAELSDPDVVALRDYVRQIGPNQSAPAEPRFQMAEADNAFDALREFLRGNEKPTPPPGGAPDAAPAHRRRAQRHARRRCSRDRLRRISFEAAINSNYLSADVCLLCHSNQADLFGKTLMGRIATHRQGQTRVSDLPRSGLDACESRRLRGLSRRNGQPNTRNPHPCRAATGIFASGHEVLPIGQAHQRPDEGDGVGALRCGPQSHRALLFAAGPRAGEHPVDRRSGGGKGCQRALPELPRRARQELLSGMAEPCRPGCAISRQSRSTRIGMDRAPRRCPVRDVTARAG